MKKKTHKWIIICVIALGITAFLLFELVWNGVVILNSASSRDYEIRGVDVSSYQGQIDWNTLADSGISFAFIKATEGSTHVDKYFQTNFENAQKTSLAVGAYHFFSYDSSGIAQAESFISTVEAFDGMLPPVIDLEFYGDKEKDPPSRDYVSRELGAMLDALEEHYGTKPIIYTTEKVYELYLADSCTEYDIWIRNVISTPRMSDGREWTFWQYTNRERLDGYKGEEKFIDMNVFNGSEEEFRAYITEKGCKLGNK